MCAAIKGGRATVVRELIKLGADVNKQDNVSHTPRRLGGKSLAGFQPISSSNLHD